MYDWANSAFMTTIVAAVFSIYFNRVAAADLAPAAASLRFAMATTIGLSIVAVLSPILGAVADFAGIKKKMLGAFMDLGIFATVCMFFIQQGDWLLAAVLFVLGNIGASGSFVFYDSLLPHIARADEIDRVSTAGYALGYLGGTVKFSGSVADLADETRHAELPWISTSPRDHQPRRLAVSPLRCELSRCRRSPGPTRHHGVLRSDPAVVPHVLVQYPLAGSRVDRAGWATSGTWTRPSSPSRDSGAISGVPSIKMVTSSISSSRCVATVGRLHAFSASC